MKITRRKLLTSSVAAVATLAAPRLARAGVTLHPDPSGDDWAQFDAAMSGLRSNRLGWVEFEQLSSAVNFNLKKSVNATGLWSASLRFSPGSIVTSNGFTGDGAGRPAPLFDFSNSQLSEIICEGNVSTFLMGFNTSSPAGTVKPNCAIMAANVDTKKIRNLCTGGQFSSAAVAFVSCSDFDIIDCGIGNSEPGSPLGNGPPALILSSLPDWGLWSPYSTFASYGFVNDGYVRSRVHSIYTPAPWPPVLPQATWTVYVRNGNNIEFDHCLFDNNNRAHMLFQGTSSNIVMDGGKGYSELGVALAGVVESGGTVNELKMIGVQPPPGCPRTIGSGYSGLQII